jgi:transcriptional repressor NrdR
MVCIYCGVKTSVTNSRHQKKSNQVWRRRQCANCSGIFTTLEQTDLPLSLLYKKDSSHIQPFSRDKLFLSLYNSLKHRNTALNDATALTSTVIGKLLPTIKDASVERADIIQTITETLKHFDKAASVTYVAYHPQ